MTAAIRGGTVWLTGLPAAGKTTIAQAVQARLAAAGTLAYCLDGDVLRSSLNRDLGFSAEDRAENVRRIAEVACLFADAGVLAICPVISPYAAGRAGARALHDAARLPFLEVFVDTPLAECERRDPKGLYARARRGELRGLTGIDDPYEPPTAPDVIVHPLVQTIEQSADAVLDAMAALAVSAPKGPGP